MPGCRAVPIPHEIRSPITASRSLAQQMGEDPITDADLEYASAALQELDRVERSISRLLCFARGEGSRFDALCLQDGVASVADA